jgi:hypothetical protein
MTYRPQAAGTSDGRADSPHPVVIALALLVLLACAAGPTLMREAAGRSEERLAAAAATNRVSMVDR